MNIEGMMKMENTDLSKVRLLDVGLSSKNSFYNKFNE